MLSRFAAEKAGVYAPATMHGGGTRTDLLDVNSYWKLGKNDGRVYVVAILDPV